MRDALLYIGGPVASVGMNLELAALHHLVKHALLFLRIQVLYRHGVRGNEQDIDGAVQFLENCTHSRQSVVSVISVILHLQYFPFVYQP